MLSRKAVVVVLCIVILGFFPLHSQSPTATVNGQVRDTSGAVVQDADVQLINDTTNVRYPAKTNNDGIYSVTGLPPGTYHLQVSKAGFKTIIKPDIRLNVLDARAINFDLPVGAVSETVTVEGGVSLVNTESAEVSTVVDRQFAENIPLNGRSFQTLLQLTPGLVLTPMSDFSPGQFSVNGQRTSANYFMVDGVSANIGTSTSPAPFQSASGAVAGFSVLGGTNNLVSVDALQEFRIQTSTYAPEFGRTPGAQVSIETRSGANQFHGTLFDYLRNDAFDANNWFTDLYHLRKPAERQNDFGGVFGGPLVKNRTFFFFSYEGLRLRLPQTAINAVPSLQVRQDPNTPAVILPFLNAFPVPAATAPPLGGTDLQEFDASYSNRATLDAASLRIDHHVNSKLSIFGRYNYAPSESLARNSSVNNLTDENISTQTLTVGATWSPTPHASNDFRFNYSRNSASGRDSLDTFGGGVVPPDSFLLPAPFTTKTAHSVLNLSSVSGGTGQLGGSIAAGKDASNIQRQINLVDGFSIVEGRHSLKFGVDYRRLSPTFSPPGYQLDTIFTDVPSAVALQVLESFVTSSITANVIFNNLGVYGQDSWKVSQQLSLTYGLRWDVDIAPHTASGPPFLAVTGYNNLSSLSAAPTGTPIFHTTYNNFAPRVGLAYLLSPSKGHETVLRGGFGVFYDLATTEAGDQIFPSLYPFSAGNVCFTGGFPTGCPVNLMFPLPPSVTQPAQISLSNALTNGLFVGFDPNLKLPYTLQWNLALSQSLGPNQTLSASYVAAMGRRLIQQQEALAPTSNIGEAFLDGNTGTSDYHALQLQFQRRVSAGLQALASYSWSHSIDTGSTSAAASGSIFARGTDPNINRGDSDFDVRNSFSAGLTYDIPAAREKGLFRMAAGGWSIESMIQARSALPLLVQNSSWLVIDTSIGSAQVTVRPDVVPGQPFYLHGSACAVLAGSICPGGIGLNPTAFVSPPVDPNNPYGGFSRQGNLGRNALRGFGAAQWDFAVHREFALKEALRLQFRAEMFNLLNHPNFADPIGDLANPAFGESTSTLNVGLNGGSRAGTGGFSQLYQIGGPRSIQLALRFQF
jgi:hypothetical protein